MVEVATLLVEVEYRCLEQIKMAWERLAHVELSTAGDIIDSGTFTAKKNLKIIYYGISSSGINGYMRFNQDNGSNYAIRLSDNGGSDGAYATRTMLAHDVGTATTNQYAVSEITNISDKEKLVIGHVMNAETAGAGNVPTRRELAGKWVNTSAQITRIQIDNGGSGDFAAGSYITVLGAKEAATSDSITTDTFTAKKHLMIQAKTISDGQVTANYRFNADSGSNYARRQSSNGGSDGTGTSQNVILAGYGTSGETTFITTHVINEATKEKLVITELVTNGSGNGAGNAPNRREIVGKWANTSNAITSVTLFNNDTGSFAEGTEVTVYGTD